LVDVRTVGYRPILCGSVGPVRCYRCLRFAVLKDPFSSPDPWVVVVLDVEEVVRRDVGGERVFRVSVCSEDDESARDEDENRPDAFCVLFALDETLSDDASEAVAASFHVAEGCGRDGWVWGLVKDDADDACGDWDSDSCCCDAEL